MQKMTLKMKNEPLSETYAEPKAKSRRAGKPNFTPNVEAKRRSAAGGPNGSRATGQESRFMQNEPNFIPKAPTKHANGANFPPQFLPKNYQLLLKSAPKSAHFYSKNAKKNTHFSQTFMQNEPKSEAYAETKAKSEPVPTPRERAGKPNFKPTASKRSEYPSRVEPTDHGTLVTGHELCKTNPISIKRNISIVITKTYENLHPHNTLRRCLRHRHSSADLLAPMV
jgi:hypothetical protein